MTSFSVETTRYYRGNGELQIFKTILSHKISSINLALFLLGIICHLIAELSALPILAALIYFGIGWITVTLPKIGGFWERHIYTRVFLVGLLVSGISGLFRTFFMDEQGDAASFFRRATSSVEGWTLVDITNVSEGAIAIILWRGVFDLGAAIGFPKEQYIGIFLNVLVVAFSSVISLKAARLLYGYDKYRFKLLTLLFSSCGLLWLFSGMMYRDSIVMLGVTLLVHSWLFFLVKPGFGLRLCIIVGSSLFAFAYFGFLRTEFVFVPIAMAMAAVTALIFGKKIGRGQVAFISLSMIGLLIAGWLSVTMGKDVFAALQAGKAMYQEAGQLSHDSGSLGMSLIVDQPLPIRLILGFIYLFVYPIPFWTGFQLESVYHLFQSFNVIYFYFLIPLLALALLQIKNDKTSRSSSVLFILFLVGGFTFAIAGTTLETRHHGAFIVPIFLLALLPNLRIKSLRKYYRQLLYLFLISVLCVHFLWVILKYGILPLMGASILMVCLFIYFIVVSKITRRTGP